MLKYIWMVIEDLFLAVTFVTLIHTLFRRRFGKKILWIHWAGIGIGTVSSIALAIVKNTTNKKLVLAVSVVCLIIAVVFMVTIPLPTSGGIFG